MCYLWGSSLLHWINPQMRSPWNETVWEWSQRPAKISSQFKIHLATTSARRSDRPPWISLIGRVSVESRVTARPSGHHRPSHFAVDSVHPLVQPRLPCADYARAPSRLRRLRRQTLNMIYAQHAIDVRIGFCCCCCTACGDCVYMLESNRHGSNLLRQSEQVDGEHCDDGKKT